MNTQEELAQALANLSPAALQRHASRLLHTYCEAKFIRHGAIEKLIAHLDSFPECGGLTDWERKGATLPLNGRGDNMPPDLLHCISSQDIDDFRVIVDCAVEVGLVDMYSTPTEHPIKFIEMICLILSRNNIALPRL
ncbi:hypothetical protein C1893_19570 [Pseudomonas sp. MPR-ANC1]|uniref:hypothetical protein n=1 Tax=Pseudomonas sp. MPR-ANC1 TaxID=2075548 RepID=UPI000CD1C893|nr:hypothetical protein [Pseudomonas sp. MPR-ANC1]POA46546.1 hypothetical protein C1893_19570 [Pseudomonas sp. MPR-ANC1]